MVRPQQGRIAIKGKPAMWTPSNQHEQPQPRSTLE